MNNRAYRCSDLRVVRSGRTVLDIQDLTLEAGCVTAVVGPNGAGKTTLLRLLAFLQTPQIGRIAFYDQPVTFTARALSALRRQVTLVAQFPFLFHRSVRANVAFGLRARGLSADGRVDAALEAVGLRSFADRPAWKLSGGEAQRVAIARALAIEPRVYLFDEPTANIDRHHVGLIESLIVSVAAAGRTVILTTHNLEQAHRLARVVLSLVDGRPATEAIGPPAE